MPWMVTGGAGYIGAHVVRALISEGLEVVVVDNLSSGFTEFVPDGVPFYRVDLLNKPGIEAVFSAEHIEGIIHVAGFKYAGESVKQPLHTFQQNVTATLVLLQAALDAGVTNIVFSSSAAVYGNPDVDIVLESTPKSPESPYGETKLIGEWLLADLARSNSVRHTSLRYFNVVGSGAPDLYDSSPYNLFPLVFGALTTGTVPKLFGDDYPTPDGTNVRDYVHVADIAAAHVAAAKKMLAGDELESVYNLGSGTGHSVAEIMAAISRVTGIPFEPEHCPRRLGDPPRIVAGGELAARDLDWKMRFSLDEMVDSAWRAFRSAQQ